jgi:hypothetical protein
LVQQLACCGHVDDYAHGLDAAVQVSGDRGFELVV